MRRYVITDPRSGLNGSDFADTGWQKTHEQQMLVEQVYGTTDREANYVHAHQRLDTLLARKQAGDRVFMHEELRTWKELLDRSILVLLEPDDLAEFDKYPRYSMSEIPAHKANMKRLQTYLEVGRKYLTFIQTCQTEIRTKLATCSVPHFAKLINKVRKLNICKDALTTVYNNREFILTKDDIRVMEQTLREVVINITPLEATFKNRTDDKGKEDYKAILELMQILDLCKVKSLVQSVLDESAQNCEMIYNQSNTSFTYSPDAESIASNLKLLKEILQFQEALLTNLSAYSTTISSWPSYHPNSGRMQTISLDRKGPPALTVAIILWQTRKSIELKSEENVSIIQELTIGKIHLIALRMSLDRETDSTTYIKAEDYLNRLEKELGTARNLLQNPVFQKYEILRLNAFEYILEIKNTILNLLLQFQAYDPKPEEVERHSAICGEIGTASSTMYRVLQQQKSDFTIALATIKQVGNNLHNPNNKVLKDFFQLYHNITIVFIFMQHALHYYEVMYRFIPENNIAFKRQLVEEQIELIAQIQTLLTSLERQFGQDHLMKFYVKTNDGRNILIDVMQSNDELLRAGKTPKVYLGKKIQLVREYYEGVELGFKKLLSELSAGQRDVTTADYLNSFGAILPDELEEILKQDEQEKAHRKQFEEKAKQKGLKKKKSLPSKQLESKSSPDTKPFVTPVQAHPKTSLVPKCDANLRKEFDKLLENLYTKQFDFNGLRSTLRTLPRLINQAQNLELVFEVNSAMGDAYDMMARKIQLCSKTPVTRDTNGRPNGIRKLTKNYDYSKMASETISCLEASINYYKYADRVLQKLHGKIPEVQYNLKYQWLLNCLEERTVKLRELRTKFIEDDEFLRRRRDSIRYMQGEEIWKSRNKKSPIALYREALNQCNQPFAVITKTLEEFTLKLAKHKLTGKPRQAVECGYVSHQYASQTKALPTPADQDFIKPTDASQLEEPYELAAAPDGGEDPSMGTVAAIEQQPVDPWLQATQLPQSIAFYPPCNFPYPLMHPQALQFANANNMLYTTGAWLPQLPQQRVMLPGAMASYPQVYSPYQPYAVIPYHLSIPPFVEQPEYYMASGYVVPQYQQPQVQFTYGIPEVVCEEQQQDYARHR